MPAASSLLRRGSCLAAVLLAAAAAWLAVPAGVLPAYGCAAVLLAAASAGLRPAGALLALLPVLGAHLAAGVAHAGALAFTDAELRLLAGWTLVAAAAVLLPALLRPGRRLALPVVVLSACALLLSLAGQRHAFHPIVRGSTYVTMDDGVELAVDHYLPRGREAAVRLPTVVTFTRYHRATAFRFPFNVLLSRSSGHRERLAAAGYATVVVDVRGAGASTGHREAEFSPREAEDAVAIVDWIVSQSWSNGLVGAEGVSYSATAAELLMLEEHPAIRAIAAQYGLFDSYSEAALPGGLVNLSIARGWAAMLRALDRNAPIPGMDGFAAWVWAGVAPVPGREATLARALVEHEDNRYVDLGSGDIEYRDERLGGHPGFAYAPAGYLEAFRRSETPLLLVSGWADGAYQLGALRKFRNRPAGATHVAIGPWNHGPGAVTDPCRGEQAYRGRRSDLVLPFFDYYLKGVDNGFGEQPALRYYTYCANRWSYASAWPPASRERVLYLDRELLQPAVATRTFRRRLEDDRQATTGPATRWRSLVEWRRPTRYPDRAAQAAHGLAWTSAPLEKALVVTGHPLLSLYLSSEAADAALFAYLEAVAPDGTVTYITEGQLRLRHRATTEDFYDDYAPVRPFTRAAAEPLEPGRTYEVPLGLYPVSYRFEAGHRIRLLLTRADADNFLPLDEGAGVALTLHGGPALRSRLVLPVEDPGLRRWRRDD